MLCRVRADGYKNLRETELDLKQDGPTVLLGPNGSGKSSLFGAIRLLREASAGLLRDSHIAGDRFVDYVEHGDIGRKIQLEARAGRADRQAVWDLTVGRQSDAHNVQVMKEELSDGVESASRDALAGKMLVNRKPVEFSLPEDQTLCYQSRSNPGYRDNSANDIWRGFAETINESLGPVRIAQLNPVSLAKPVSLGRQVEVDGYGLAAELLNLSSTRRKSFAEIQDRFCHLFPWVEEIELPTVTRYTSPDWAQGFEVPNGPQGVTGFQGSYGAQGLTTAQVSQVELRFREKGVARSYPACQMASGMLLALALLWMAHRPDGDRIICFDEPENSVHPYLLKYVYDLLKGLTKAEPGRPPIQVLVATHSVDFVNLCEPDEVRICERHADGQLKVQSIRDKKDLESAVDDYKGAMGELWFSGALGGLASNGSASPRSR
jgi:predicted ATPase